MVICCAVCLAALGQSPVKPLSSDSVAHAVDSLKKVADTLPRDTAALPDSSAPVRDSFLHDSTWLARDSLRRDSLMRDSIRKASAVPSAVALQHQIDSANAATSIVSDPAVDSLKLRMDAMMARASQHQPLSNAFSPTTGSTPGSPGTAAPPGLVSGVADTSHVTTAGTDSSHAAAKPRRDRQGRPQPAAKVPQRTPRNAPPVLSNFHRKYIPVQSGKIPIDSMSLIPGTFLVKDVADSAYHLDWVNSKLIWRHPPAGHGQHPGLYYRTFPYRLNAVAKRFNYDSIESYFLVRPYDGSRGGTIADDNFFDFGNITYNGSFGCSISFGNSQDAVVTSNLNLQISGYLADSIRIDAAITDNNIPIQPDGTTADLNEFDKIFLQFSKKNWTLTMGDIDLKQNQNYFLSFYKRLQGASFETTEQIDAHTTNKVLASAAIAKGKFNRNIFEGQEGNQGPYQLTGANGETFLIVLAGTEKVFIDGQQMQRGENADYTINYNTAEITFTPNRPITQDARIQVEFEYADRNYLNTNLYLYDELHVGDKLKVRMGLFQNSDAKNQPIDQTLTSDENVFLNRLGDSITHAYYPVANVDTMAPGKILYMKVDTTYKNAAGQIVNDSIYEFSANTAVTLYNLSFANVGQGYGDYVPDLNGVNGNVYMWVAPVNGVPQGSYEAAQFLVTPKTQQVATVGVDYALDKHTTMSADLAASNYNQNTLSTIEKNNDAGYAGKFQFRNVKALGAASQGLQLTTNSGV